jgi:hypothetical protein
MDELALTTLAAELQADARVAGEAARLAALRFGQGQAPELEAAAFQLNRCFNAIEQAALRVARAFENNIDDDAGWHVALLRRLSLEIPGIRPWLLPADLLPDLKELRAFRHLVRHAYELELEAPKLRTLVERAVRVGNALPAVFANFQRRVAADRGWPIPP